MYDLGYIVTWATLCVTWANLLLNLMLKITIALTKLESIVYMYFYNGVCSDVTELFG